MKKRFVAIIATALVLAVCIFFNAHVNCPDIKVTIYNHTNVALKGLVITYDDSHEGKKVATLSRHNNCNVNIDLPDGIKSGKVSLHYFDKDKKEHNQVIIPKLEKGQNEKVKVHINKVKKNDILEIEV